MSASAAALLGFAAFIGNGFTSPFAVHVMLKPFRSLRLNFVSPLKLCVECASTKPSFDLVNQY